MKPGEVVYLKSGSHKMTISSISGDTVSCYWAIDGKIQGHNFFKEMLTPIDHVSENELLKSNAGKG